MVARRRRTRSKGRAGGGGGEEEEEEEEEELALALAGDVDVNDGGDAATDVVVVTKLPSSTSAGEEDFADDAEGTKRRRSQKKT